MIAEKHSRREARRASHESKDRTLRKMERRLREIWEIQRDRNRGLKPLVPPIFAGYKREFVIREDILRSPYAKAAQTVLPYVQVILYCRRKDFTAKDRKTKQWKEIPHDLAGIGRDRWKRDKLEETLLSEIRKHFRLEPTKPQYSKETVWVYRFAKPWWFETKQSRYYFTHYRDADGALESEEKRISNKLKQEQFWDKKYGRGHDDWDRPFDHQDPLDSKHWDRHLEALIAE